MTGPFRVLYVDDEPALLQIGKLFLENSGNFSVTTIDSALTALNLLNEEQFDAIISDYQMPGIDGIKFLIEVRNKLEKIPFILFTGKGREEVVIEALNEGADFYLQKGGEPTAQFTELSNKVLYAITSHRSEIALRESEERVRKKLDALLSPMGDVGTLDLTDVFDTTAVQLLMNDFYALTKVGIGIIDLHGKVLVGTGWQDICTRFHRVNPESCKNCVESDLQIASGNAPGTFRMYKCKNNIWDIVTPIYLGDTHIGNIFLGQFLFDDEPIDYEVFRSQARRYGFDEAEYLAAMERVPRWSREKVETVMRFYTRFAGMISSLSHRNLRLARIVTDRDHLLTSLSESEERYRSVVNDQTEMIARFTADGTITFVNKAYHSYFAPGSDINELKWKNIREVMKLGESANIEKFIGSLTLETPHREIEREQEGSDRNKRWQVWSVRALFGREGQAIEYQFVGQDITRRKQAEERLSEVNNAFLSFTPDPVNNINILTGLAGRMLHGTCALYNRLEGGMLCSIGMWNTPPDFVPCDTPTGHICNDIIRKDDRLSHDYLQPAGIILRGYRPQCPSVPSCRPTLASRYRIGAKSLGSLCVVYQEHYVPTNQDLEFLLFLGQAVAIEDERRIATLALHEGEERHQDLITTTADIIWETDENANFVYISPHVDRILGYHPEEFIGKSPSGFLEPSSVESFRNAFRYPVQGSRDLVSFDSFWRHKDGHRIILETRAVPIFRTDGSLAGFRGIDRDITQRKHVEETLRRSNKKLNLLSTITRHDISNQLMVLRGYLEMLEDTQLDPSQQEYFRMITATAKRISSLILFTREYEDLGITEPTWQDCHVIVDIAVKQILPGQILVQNDIPSGTEVFADPLIARVIYNLLDNAVRYGDHITTIRFSVSEQNGDHILVCEDNGVGVPQGEKEKIFERGFGKNTGLGLAVSREILSITGITISETGEPGKGARFEMVVPKGMYR